MTEKLDLKDAERQPCEVWTRVMGYHRPIEAYNVGKKGLVREKFGRKTVHLHDLFGDVALGVEVDVVVVLGFVRERAADDLHAADFDDAIALVGLNARGFGI